MIDAAARVWNQVDGLGWFLLLLALLVLFQRALHKEIQAVFLLLTRRADISVLLFSLVFLPGVFLHELSHYLMAQMLRVRTGRFSIIPKPLKNGRLQLGFVETAETDFARDAAIGAAPLLAGGTFIAIVGGTQLHAAPLGEAVTSGNLLSFLDGLSTMPHQPDFWLWFYLVFAVSSTMFPSASDRRKWLPVFLVIALIVGTAILIGIGPWLYEQLGSGVNLAFRAAAGVFAISLGVHVVLLIPVWVVRQVLCRMMGVEVKRT